MSQDIHAHRILILDFGSQYTQLIARRVREIGVYCEIHPFDMSNEAIIAFAPRGIILAGGPESVHEADSPRAPQAVFDLKVPLFGICYGMQTMAEQMGGKVQGSDVREFGYARVDVVGKARLLDGIEDHVDDDGVLGLPRQNAAHLATQAGLIEQLLSDEQERLPGVGPQLSHEVVPGVLPYSLDAALKQRQPELLALGRHSRNALMQALLGNLAQRYLRQPSCDVLVTS